MRLAHARQPGQRSPATLSATSIVLAVVPVAVAGDEQLRLDLAEAVEHALRRRNPASRTTRPRRARRPRACRRSSRACWAASPRRGRPASTPSVAHRLLQARDQRAQFAPGQAALDLSSPRKTMRVAGAGFRSRFSAKFSRRVGKESRAGHPVAVDQHAFAALADHAAEIPDQAPERGRARSTDQPMQVADSRQTAPASALRRRLAKAVSAASLICAGDGDQSLPLLVHAFSRVRRGHSYRVAGSDAIGENRRDISKNAIGTSHWLEMIRDEAKPGLA